MPENPELTVLIHSAFPLSDGTPDGVKDSIIQLKPHLEEEGIRVILVGPRTKNNLADFTFGRSIPVKVNNTVVKGGFSLNRYKISSILNKVKPDLVEAVAPEAAPFTTHTLLSAIDRMQEIPTTVAHFHSRAEKLDIKTTLIAYLGSLRGPVLRKRLIPFGLSSGVFNTILYHYDARIASSEDTAKFWTERFEMKDFHIIQNGVDIDTMRPNLPIKQEWQDGKKTIFTSCRHDLRKGIAVLLEAYYLLTKVDGRDDIKLKIGGEGDCTPDHKRLAEELRLPDVEFLGVQTREMLARSFCSADVSAFSSKGGEGWGRVLLEAEACGSLVLATDIDGFRQALFGSPYTEMAKPGDARDLADKIANKLDMPEEEARKARILGVKHASQYSNRNIAKRTKNVYKEILLNRP